MCHTGWPYRVPIRKSLLAISTCIVCVCVCVWLSLCYDCAEAYVFNCCISCVHPRDYSLIPRVPHTLFLPPCPLPPPTPGPRINSPPPTPPPLVPPPPPHPTFPTPTCPLAPCNSSPPSLYPTDGPQGLETGTGPHLVDLPPPPPALQVMIDGWVEQVSDASRPGGWVRDYHRQPGPGG